MWYAVTANPVLRSKKETRKEFHSRSCDVLLSAETKTELEAKIQDNLEKYPEHMSKYLVAGIKFVEADTPAQAKKRAKKVAIYFNKNGQYQFI